MAAPLALMPSLRLTTMTGPAVRLPRLLVAAVSRAPSAMAVRAPSTTAHAPLRFFSHHIAHRAPGTVPLSMTTAVLRTTTRRAKSVLKTTNPSAAVKSKPGTAAAKAAQATAADASATTATTATATTPAKKPSKLRQLFKDYGRPAFFVYMAISTIDLSLSFVAVYSGVDVEKLVDTAKAYLTQWGLWEFAVDQDDVDELHGLNHPDGEGEGAVVPATPATTPKNQSLLTTFLIAYAFHKLLLPIRVPITVAVTPAVVRYLRRWGWLKDVGAVARAAQAGVAAAAVKEGTKKAAGGFLGLLTMSSSVTVAASLDERVVPLEGADRA
ncbi:hypothetical protein AMAG_05297 [Allomyces macrogynus ATCC 38327]|uniref:DUF1279 domain-containing protein n=1 Tax=Allomyces macrogynus (strain ATCC 38327) TaxID=578462 RepID=A0A0L0SBP6_ALLM3|nr:hypothetical protein AMAG_05297 [Allomyces macrogynus ATCC 38327]|eukprot:KNE59844.1 hypothetical protein AMAG_05297 [Allomyces macrogynus ATCC 38327]